MQELSYSDIPRNWAICHRTDCPLAAQCLRHHAAQVAPANLLEHNTVLPAAWQGDTCRAFVADEPVQMAYGMRNLYADVNTWDVQRLRRFVQPVFGQQSHYYRYREGRYPITPAQQARVAELFRLNGYTSSPHFDRTETRWYFPPMGK